MTKVTDLLEILKDLERLLKRSKECVAPGREQEFMLRATLVMDDCVKKLSNEANACSNGSWAKIDREWHELPIKIETLRIKYQLQKPSTLLEFQEALWWIAERGDDEDLELLGQIKNSPPYSSEEINKLFEIAEQRIRERINDPDFVLKKSEEAYQKNKKDRLEETIGLIAEKKNEENSRTDLQKVGWETFCRELPRLLQHYPGKWVAFHGERQVALESSKLEVYRYLEQTGCPLDEVIVRRIEPLGPPLDMRRFRGTRAR